MNLQSPPEIADGGYWYLVEGVQGSPGMMPIYAENWCAWFLGGNRIAVRLNAPLVGIETTGSASDALALAGYSTKPQGRTGVQ